MSPFEMIKQFYDTAIYPLLQWLIDTKIPHTNISFFTFILVPLVFDFVIMVVKYIVHGQVTSDEIHDDAHPELKKSRRR